MKLAIDQAEIDRLYDHLGRAFADAFCFPIVEHDFDKRQRFVTAAEDAGWAYRDAPNFDPRYNSLEGKGFWLNVRKHGSRSAEDEREMIGHCAVRVWRNARLADLFIGNRFLQERDSGSAIRFDCSETAHVAGTLGYIGAGWVHPEFRHRGIMGLLATFVQLHLLDHYYADYVFGLIDDKTAHAGIGARAYRFHHHHRGIVWHWPGHGDLPGWLIYNTRAEMMEELRRFAADEVLLQQTVGIRVSA
jgi:ribosomal protein S18 acetylase RimI-like enzyme